MADGMTLYKDTNLQQTHCSSNHLTSFAGGLVIMPNNINFQYVFANAAFAKNYTIYLTLIIFALIYIFFTSTIISFQIRYEIRTCTSNF